MKVTAILRKDQPDKDGFCKIVIRINEGKTKKYLATKYKVKEHQFQNGKVVKHPEASSINAALKNLVEDFRDQQAQAVVTFQSFAGEWIDQQEKEGSRRPGVIRIYRSQVKKFTDGVGILPLHLITAKTIQQYRVFLHERGNAHNTISTSYKFLKLIFNQAVKKKILKENPMKEVEPVPYKQTVRTYLEADEVKKISQLNIEPSNPLHKMRCWFLIQCYTGLRAGDLRQLNVQRIVSESQIVIATAKTNSIVSIPVSAETKLLITEAGPLNVSLEEYNRSLKSLAAAAGITKNLSTHVGRHTLGMRWLELGKSIETLQAVYGHASLKTTKIYAQVKNARVNKEFDGFGY
jgi:site-specific recombinase XerD